MKKIFLIDTNNFYVSCERIFRPELNGKPVAVLSANDGCIIARSNEVKALGISMGAPLFSVKDIIKKHNVHILSANFNLYTNISTRLMSLLSTFELKIEVYSVDEAFLEFDLTDKSALDIGISIKTTVMQNLGIPVSIGISSTKSLAKVANHFAKKYYNNICLLSNHNDICTHLQMLPISDVWGVGRQYAKQLISLGLNTALDLACADVKWIRNIMTVQGERIVHELNGISCIAINTVPDDKKSTQICKSFGRPLTHIRDLKEALTIYTQSLGTRLRLKGLKASSILVFIATNWHKEQFNRSKEMKLPFDTNDTITLLQYAMKALNTIYETGHEFKKIGIVALHLNNDDNKPKQLELMNQINYTQESTQKIKYEKISNMLDHINDKYGKFTAIFASAGTNQTWFPKSEYRSNDYTFSWSNLLLVYAK